MFRKILVSVLCLMLVLAAPLSSLAATDIALKVVPGTELAAADQNVATILNSLVLHIITEDDSFMLEIDSDKGEIASAALRADETGVYVASPFLGDRTLYFTLEEISALMVNVMRESGVDEATIAEFEQSMAQASAQPQQAQQPTAASLFENDGDLNDDYAEDMYANDPVMQQFVKNVEEKMVVTNGNFTDPAFNPADTKTEVVLTSEDIIFVLDSETLKESYASAAQSAGMTTDEMIAMMKDMFSQLDTNITVVTYTNGDELCAMQMNMTMKGDVTLEMTDNAGNTSTETATFDTVMDLTANVLTTGEVENMSINAVIVDNADASIQPISLVMNIAVDEENDACAFDGTVAEGDEAVLLFQGDFAEVENDVLKGWVALLVEGDQVTFTVSGTEEDGMINGLVSLYVRSDCTAIVEPSWSDSAIISFSLEMKEIETPALLQKLNNAIPATSVQLLQMDEAALTEEINGITVDANSALFTALGNLPNELISLLMNSAFMQ